MKLSRPLVVLDLETTGTWIEKDRIIEIAMIRYSLDGSKKTYLKRVNPRMPIPPAVVELTGISDEDVKESPQFGELAAEVLEFIGDADLGGFNVQRFDLPLLEREIFEAGHKFVWRNRNIFDAQKIYHYHEKRDLKAAYQFYCDRDLVDAHTALADTEAAFDILSAQLNKYCDTESIDALAEFSSERQDNFFDEDKKFRWWGGELYPMFGKYARKSSLKVIAEKDPGYLQWMLGQDFSDKVKVMVQDALKGHYPTKVTVT